jgi:hypothetical protein
MAGTTRRFGELIQVQRGKGRHQSRSSAQIAKPQRMRNQKSEIQ